MQALKEVYDGVKDMSLYRRRLGVMVLRLLSGEEDSSSSKQEDPNSVAQGSVFSLFEGMLFTNICPHRKS